jgi:hypothetical protein
MIYSVAEPEHLCILLPFPTSESGKIRNISALSEIGRYEKCYMMKKSV